MKWIKILGNLLTIVALFFVIEKLMSQKINYGTLFRIQNILPCLFVILVQTIIVITNVFPWKTLVSSVSGKKVSYREVIPVFVKSNLMKYIPGNVFQYAGRQELAVNKQLPQLEVAFATLMDILLNVIGAGLISLVFLHEFVGSIFSKYVNVSEISLILAVLLILIGFLIYFFRKKIKRLLQSYQHFFTRTTLFKIAQALVYYLIVLSVSSLMFLLVMQAVLGIHLQMSENIRLFSSYTLSWLVGFVVPGAPAGVGIKEAVMLEIVGRSLSAQTIALGMVVIRILLTIADVLGYLLVIVISYLSKNTRQNESKAMEDKDGKSA